MVHVARWGTHSHMDAAGNVQILVEVQWRSCTQRYAGRDIAFAEVGYDGKLLSVGNITLGTDGERNNVTIELENTDTLGTSIESLWDVGNPPEGVVVRVLAHFNGKGVDKLVELFQGTLEEVSEIRDDRVKVSVTSVETEDVRIARDTSGHAIVRGSGGWLEDSHQAAAPSVWGSRGLLAWMRLPGAGRVLDTQPGPARPSHGSDRLPC